MAGASGQSLRDLVEAFDQRWAADASTTTAEELFSVVGVLDADGALRRGLTDPSRQPEQRRGIAATAVLDDAACEVEADRVGDHLQLRARFAAAGRVAIRVNCPVHDDRPPLLDRGRHARDQPPPA